MADEVLYGRRARVLIYVPVSTPGDFQHTTVDVVEINGGDDPASPGLRVKFSAKKSREKEPNTAEVTISNLSPARRNSLQVKGVKVLLEAGYAATGLSRLFAGDARTIDHLRDGADWNTVMKLGDGERAFRYARANGSFAAGSTAGDVLRYLAGALGVAVGNVPDQAVKLTTIYDQGYVVHGPAQRALDRLLRSLGYTWSIQDGALQVLAPGQSLSISIPLISPETGLIGSPEMGSPEKKGGTSLIKIKALLMPTLPGALVALRSARYNGQVSVKKCHFTGDTHGGDWYTEIEGVLHVQ